MLFLLQCERRLKHTPKSLSEAGSMPNWWPVDIRYEDETLRLTSPKGVCVKSLCRHRKVQDRRKLYLSSETVNCSMILII